MDLLKDITSEIFSHKNVLDGVCKIHENKNDLDEGDLIHRLNRFDSYIKKDVLISDLNLHEFSVCDEVVDLYMDMYKQSGTCPPIVFDSISGSIIDGTHRANALSRLGLSSIPAFVGTSENEDPNWTDDWSESDDSDEDEFDHPSD